ncbi:hypothetical protein DPMN_061615 [Dreissena polymorpha]|uniref:EF-hand domain-containing protein n=1 Tax=Dreissena polymorpha TaxID=45954 RepID=A0A9D4HJC4_DREPO|nr:hypothetical protein DPMN_061615 [Dreissena polymorpha]
MTEVFLKYFTHKSQNLSACTLNQRSSGSGHVFDDSPQARAMFRKADRDQNEYLTYGEFQNVFRSYDNNNHLVYAQPLNFILDETNTLLCFATILRIRIRTTPMCHK